MSGLLVSLCALPSVSGDLVHLHKIVDFLKEQFVRYPDAYIQKVVHNDVPALIVQNFDGKHADIILNGHIDVVPPTADDQFVPRTEGGRCYARGAGDMKAGIVVIVEVMKRLLDQRYADKKVMLMITGDEEVGGCDGAGRLVSQGYTGKVVLIPDGGALDEIVIAEKGLMMLEITVPGVAGHSARPRLAMNAADQAFALYHALKNTLEDVAALQAPGHRSTTVALTSIHAGKASNVIPGECVIGINIRHTEQYNQETIHAIVANLSKAYDATRRELLYGSLLYAEENNARIQAYHTCATSVLGKNIQLTKEHGASDGRFFAATGATIILHRPTCAHIHGADERVRIDDIPLLIEVYERFITTVAL